MSDEGASFTQLVWKGTKEVGFGIAKNQDGVYFFVAEYLPSGNIRGQYETNVLPLTDELIRLTSGTLLSLSYIPKEDRRKSNNSNHKMLNDNENKNKQPTILTKISTTKFHYNVSETKTSRPLMRFTSYANKVNKCL